MYFDVYINDEKLGTFGHADVENLSIAVSGIPDDTNLYAGAVCCEEGKQFYYHWVEKKIKPKDEIRIVHVEAGSVPEPIKKLEMNKPKKQGS